MSGSTGVSVTAASAAFGYSRPSFYQAAAALDEQGLDGLVAGQARPAPRTQAHRRRPARSPTSGWRRPGTAPRGPGRADRDTGSACARTPARSSARWPATGSRVPKAAASATSEGSTPRPPQSSPPRLPTRARSEAPSRRCSRYRARPRLRNSYATLPCTRASGVPARLRAAHPPRRHRLAPALADLAADQDPPITPATPARGADARCRPRSRRTRRRPGRPRARRHLARSHSSHPPPSPSTAALSARGRSTSHVRRHRRVEGDRRSPGQAAPLDVRQSTLKQVIHNAESAHRQYDLRGRAIALGWADDQIPSDRHRPRPLRRQRRGPAAFQHLVAEVSLGRLGIVLGLECSRLAGNSADWHQLLDSAA